MIMMRLEFDSSTWIGGLVVLVRLVTLVTLVRLPLEVFLEPEEELEGSMTTEEDD